jgi:hypothetical protein
VKKFWPYDLFSYQEEAVLCYLAFKNYDVELSLTSLQANVDELIALIRVLNAGIHVSSRPKRSFSKKVTD